MLPASVAPSVLVIVSDATLVATPTFATRTVVVPALPMMRLSVSALGSISLPLRSMLPAVESTLTSPFMLILLVAALMSMALTVVMLPKSVASPLVVTVRKSSGVVPPTTGKLTVPVPFEMARPSIPAVVASILASALSRSRAVSSAVSVTSAVEFSEEQRSALAKSLEKRLDRDVLARKPNVVVIYIGINDVWHSLQGKGTSKKDFESGLGRLIERIETAGARVVLCTPSVIGEKPAGSNPLDKMLAEYSAISRGVAARTGVQLLDLNREFHAYLGRHNPLGAKSKVLTGDGVHLSAAGNRFVAARMLGAKVSSFVGLAEVMFAVLFAWLLLAEMPAPVQLVGGVLNRVAINRDRYYYSSYSATYSRRYSDYYRKPLSPPSSQASSDDVSNQVGQKELRTG